MWKRRLNYPLRLYWGVSPLVPPGQPGRLQYMDLPIGGVLDLYVHADVFDITGVVTDGRTIYWTVVHGGLNNLIRSAPADGSGPITTLVAGEPQDSFLDIDDTYIYWAQVVANGAIRRCLRDGTGVVSLVTNQNVPLGIRRYGSYLYWCNAGGNEVRRSLLDGSSVTVLINTIPVPFAVAPAVSATFGPSLFVSENAGNIHRSAIDGTGVVQIVAGLGGPPSGLWATANWLYFCYQTPNVYRCDHAGAGIVQLNGAPLPAATLALSTTPGAP